VRALDGIRCHLHIVGRLNDNQLRELDSANVDFSAAHDLSERQMYEAYCDADLVSFVSIYEGFGMPILEANAVGRPVVTGGVSSMPDVAGQAACFVDPRDVHSIRSGITRVIDDRDYRDQLVERGFENVKRFRIGAVAEQYIQLYRRLIGC
jgi:glycosyltransferase involved in cell wall biosynthesis